MKAEILDVRGRLFGRSVSVVGVHCAGGCHVGRPRRFGAIRVCVQEVWVWAAGVCRDRGGTTCIRVFVGGLSCLFLLRLK